MLNLGFSPRLEEAYGESYSIPADLADELAEANSEFATGPELRTQGVYGDELWLRISGAGLDRIDWGALRVLDACCGTGFLSYHLLAHVTPRELVLVDISAEELADAERLLSGASDERLQFVCADLADAGVATKPFDVVIGNSFLHHFPDVPVALSTIHSLVCPGGWFVSLHEPTPAAVPLESGQLRHLIAYTLSPRRYMNRLRHRGPGPVREGTADVWMFDPDDVARMLVEAGFTEVLISRRYVVRPFLVAALGLGLSSQRPRLSLLKTRLLAAAVRIDELLARVLPNAAFGGFAIAARRR